MTHDRERDSERSPPTEIYEHSPSSLLPLLQLHLPASILVYGSILSPSSSSSKNNIRIWSSIPSQDDGSPIPTDAEGTIIVQLSSLAGGQLRIFDTLDSVADADMEEGDLERGIERVVRTLKGFMEVDDASTWKAGGLHERWVMPVVNHLGDGVDPEREHVWLPPRDLQTSNAGGGPIEGYEVDIGREADIEAFSNGSAIPRDPAYYRSRLPWSTVIRPTTPSSDSHTSQPSSEAPPIPLISVCRILTSADGSLGTLSTDDPHRRKGLSQWVIREHLASGRGSIGGMMGQDEEDDAVAEGTDGLAKEKRHTCAVVFDQNIASQEMFRKMGWERRWGVAWVMMYRPGHQ